MTQNAVYYSGIAAQSAIGFGRPDLTGGHTAHERFFCVQSMASSFMDGPCGRLFSLPVPVTGRPICMVPFTLLVEGRRKTQPFNRTTIMSNTISIGHTTELPLVFYKNQPVVTFSMIDSVHGRPEGTAGRSFRTNKTRFIEGEDFYVVDSSCLDEFRRNYPGVVSEATRRDIRVITETGYLMLVKSFTDDLAWQIQRQLIKAYFRARPPVIKTITKSQFIELRRIVDSIGNKLPYSQSVEWHIWKRIREMFGVKNAKDLPATEFEAANNVLLQLKATTDEFNKQVEAVQKRFCKEVLLVDEDMGDLVKQLEQID